MIKCFKVKCFSSFGIKLPSALYISQLFIHFPETLRKHPIAATLKRVALNDYAVPNTDHVIEKGTWIKIPVSAIQSDPRYYPNPEKFDPDRFQKDQIRNRHAMTWLPFGEGPRGCVGDRFAMMQMKVGIVTLLSNFELSVCSQTIKTVVYDIKCPNLAPSKHIYLKIRSIKS